MAAPKFVLVDGPGGCVDQQGRKPAWLRGSQTETKSRLECEKECDWSTAAAQPLLLSVVVQVPSALAASGTSITPLPPSVTSS